MPHPHRPARPHPTRRFLLYNTLGCFVLNTPESRERSLPEGDGRNGIKIMDLMTGSGQGYGDDLGGFYTLKVAKGLFCLLGRTFAIRDDDGQLEA